MTLAGWGERLAVAGWEAAVLAALLLLAARLAGRRSAPLRRALSALALVAFALPPSVARALGLALPAGLGLASWPGSLPSPAAVSLEGGSLAAAPSWTGPALAALAALQLAGAAVFAVLILRQAVRSRAWIAAGNEAGGTLAEDFAALAARLGFRRPPRLVVAPGAPGPLASGLFRRTVLLPEALAAGGDRDALSAILAHELGHLRPLNVALRCLRIALAGLWWFHPVYWWVARELRRAEEDGCDDLVLCHRLASGERFAETLLWAARLAREPAGGLAALRPAALAEHALARRLRRLADPGLPRPRRLGLPGRLLLAALALSALPSASPSPATSLPARGAHEAAREPETPPAALAAPAATSGSQDRVPVLIPGGREGHGPSDPQHLLQHAARHRAQHTAGHGVADAAADSAAN